MALTEHDRADITDLVNLHGHLVDAGELDAAGELFTADVVYDLSDFGLGLVRGTAAVREAALALGEANPVAHHVTNVVITAVDEDSARVRSKGLGVTAAGSVASVVYDDVVTRRPEGWRIWRRTVTARRVPLGGRHADPGEVLERYRQAAVDRSAEALRRLYAAGAVHEFPFAYPGVPTRLEGRDDIVAWIAAGWQADLLRYDSYRTLAVHATTDPETIVVEQEALGTGVTGAFALPNLMILTVRNGEIVRLRDYVNVLAAAAALGQDPSTGA
jgi:ketosteroid isomerase-like protein